MRAGKWAAIGLAMMLVPGAAAAAVAPWYERVRQLDAVMEMANEAAGKLAPKLIDRVEAQSDGSYRFGAKDCFVAATLEVLPPNGPPMPGSRADYRATLGKVQCE
jgi:hypothetical protein